MTARPSEAVSTPAPAPAVDLAGLIGVKLGNYRLERLIGQGRMGAVYAATDEALLRATAVKVLSWSREEARGHDPVQWFLAEARAVARINHPRVVQIYGAARQGDHCYLAMEYVAGRSAEALVAGGVPVPPDVATTILQQIASALHAAHRSGVVHRDVKPANLLVGAGGITKLGDFGMALGPPEVRRGNAHVRVGSPYYTAPEVWRGEPATAASDVYSLGATFFHLLTGRPPFVGTDVAAVERAHLSTPIPDPRELVPELPPSCSALVLRALAKSRTDRHPSAQALMWDARRVLQDLAPRGPPPKPPTSYPAAPPRRAVALRPACPHLSAIGFVHQPFCDVDPGQAPELAATLAAAVRDALRHLDDATPMLAVTGSHRSGVAAVCRHIGDERGPSRLVLRGAASGSADERALLQKLCRAANADGASADERLEALVAALAAERDRRGVPPLVIVEGVTGQPPAGGALASLARAALWTRSFQLVVSSGPGLRGRFAQAGLDTADVREVAVAALDFERLGAHVRSWLDATLDPVGAPVLVTRDALIVVAYRTRGVLEHVNCLLHNMAWLAAAEGRRTLSSWHAWAAPDAERWRDPSAAAGLPRRPLDWPPPEVADVLDAGRPAALAAHLDASTTNWSDRMTDLTTIAKLPDVKSAVLGDLAGGYFNALGESDGETIAAVMGFVASTLSTVGDELGMGALRRVSISAESSAWVVAVDGNAVLTACIQPAKSLAAIEKTLDASVHEKV